MVGLERGFKNMNKPEIYKKVEETVFKGLDALFIKNGAAHAEFRLLPDGNIFSNTNAAIIIPISPP